MLSAQQASTLYTKMCIAAARRNPDVLNGLHQHFPECVCDDSTIIVNPKYYLPTVDLAKAVGDPGLDNAVASLIRHATFFGQGRALLAWCDQHIGPGVVAGCDAGQLLIDMRRLQALCGGELQKKSACR